MPEPWFGFLQASYHLSSTCVCAVIQKVDYVFAENGLVAYKNGELLSVQVSCLFFVLFFFLNMILSAFFFPSKEISHPVVNIVTNKEMP